jgi:hypothetical protein
VHVKCAERSYKHEGYNFPTVAQDSLQNYFGEIPDPLQPALVRKRRCRMQLVSKYSWEGNIKLGLGRACGGDATCVEMATVEQWVTLFRCTML